MEDSDVDMEDSDVNNGSIFDGWLPFKIPYPPKFPGSIAMKGNYTLVDPDLELYAKNFGATDNPDGKGFQIRQLNKADPIGGKFSDDEFDVKYRLGSSSESRHWHDLVHKWGLQLLDRAGFINVPIQEPEEDDPVGRHARNLRDITKDLNEQIHPVFRKEMWRNMDDAQYATIRTPLLLATAFLDDPITLQVFHAISSPDRWDNLVDSKLGLCRRLRLSGTLTDSDLKATYDKMADMRKYTSFYWEDHEGVMMKNSAAAFTDIRYGTNKSYDPASGPLTRKSDIAIGRMYYNVLRDYETRSQDNAYEEYFEDFVGLAGIPQNRKPRPFDLDCAIRRTEFLFACVLVHEFAHAFSLAYFEKPDMTEPAKQLPDEPWLPGNRSNELGDALIDHILKGVPKPQKFFQWPMSFEHMHRQYYYSPYGICFAGKWDAWKATNENEDVLLEGRDEDHNKRYTYYPMPQKQVNEMFHRDTWEHYVVRLGLGWISLERIEEWAAHRVQTSIQPGSVNKLR